MNPATQIPNRTRVRALIVGVGLPVALVLGVWWITASIHDLPAELPAHWSGPGIADSFLPPSAIVSSWLVGAAVVTVATVSVCVGSLHSGWSPLGRGVTAVCFGAVGAVLIGLLALIFTAQGRTTEQVVALGLGPSFLGVLAGFIVALAAGFWLLPKATPSR